MAETQTGLYEQVNRRIVCPKCGGKVRVASTRTTVRWCRCPKCGSVKVRRPLVRLVQK